MIFIKIIDFGGVRFFENVFSPKGWLKNSPKKVCLAGKILVTPPTTTLCPILNPPNAHIRQIRKITENSYTKNPISIYIYIYFLLIPRCSFATITADKLNTILCRHLGHIANGAPPHRKKRTEKYGLIGYIYWNFQYLYSVCFLFEFCLIWALGGSDRAKGSWEVH